jgi:ubiquinone/menaquinone biosynthesis C-methylase UbiE
VNRKTNHYSYAVYADAATARSFEAQRFGGPIGQLVAGTQARVIVDMIGRVDGRRILDVGTGAGRAALMLARGGARVTAVDASEEMLLQARARAADALVTVDFLRGDAHDLQFEDRAFEIGVCLRVLMHAPDWRRCLAELCRVSDRLVLFDYPSFFSAAVLESMGRRLKHAVGGRTEPYRALRRRSIERVLGRYGFRIRSIHRQFVLPIQFHRMIGSRRFTEFSERLLDRVGLLRRFGSPVTVCAERCEY